MTFTEPVAIDRDGALRVAGSDRVLLHAPVAFQQHGDRRQPVEVRFASAEQDIRAVHTGILHFLERVVVTPTDVPHRP